MAPLPKTSSAPPPAVSDAQGTGCRPSGLTCLFGGMVTPAAAQEAVPLRQLSQGLFSNSFTYINELSEFYCRLKGSAVPPPPTLPARNGRQREVRSLAWDHIASKQAGELGCEPRQSASCLLPQTTQCDST